MASMSRISVRRAARRIGIWRGLPDLITLIIVSVAGPQRLPVRGDCFPAHEQIVRPGYGAVIIGRQHLIIREGTPRARGSTGHAIALRRQKPDRIRILGHYPGAREVPGIMRSVGIAGLRLHSVYCRSR